MHLTKEWLIDAAERVVSVFVLTFVTALVASTNSGHINLSTLEAAGFAGVVAALEVVRSLLASVIPDTLSPASIVKKVGSK